MRRNMGLNINPADISVCHRVSIPKNSDWAEDSSIDSTCPPIYIKFLSRDVKNHVLKSRFSLRGQVNQNGFKFLVKENLTPFRRELLYAVKDRLRDYRFIWTKEGEIRVRRYSDSKIEKINSYADLDKLAY